MSKKLKIEVDKRAEFRDFTGKIYDPEAILLTAGEPIQREVLAEAMDGAGWSDDPAQGRAILLPDGRELPNPMPIAPPISISQEPSVNELVERALARHYAGLQADEEIDTLEECDDFPEDEEFWPGSQFEVVLRDESPAIPPDTVVSEDEAEALRETEAELPKKAIPAKKMKAPKETPAPRSDDLEGE